MTLSFSYAEMWGVPGMQENGDHRLLDSTRKPSSGTGSDMARLS
jgi:hypothetical protein